MKTIFIIFIIAALFSTTALAQTEINITKLDLDKAEMEMEEMMEEGFNVVRYNDTLLAAKQEYDIQMFYISQNKSPDFGRLKTYLSKLSDIKQLAYKTRDELIVLEGVLNETMASGVDVSEAQEVFKRAKSEFLSERYEQAKTAIDETYKKISEAEAVQAKLRQFYEATSRTFTNFIKANWKELLISTIVILIVIVLSYNGVRRYLIMQKIAFLERRKDVIRNLIAQAQRLYFEKGVLNEEEYHIKVSKYGEILRDINRQIPILKEELIKIKPNVR